MWQKLSFILGVFLLVSIRFSFSEDTIQQVIHNSCPESNINKYETKFIPLAKRLHKKINETVIQKSLQASLPVSCFLGYAPWKAALAWQLAIFGKTKGLDDSIIAGLTELLSIRTIGKKQYVSLGKLWQKMQQTGEEEDFIARVLGYAIENGYSSVGAEALALIYIHLRKENPSKDPEKVLIEAATKTKKWKFSHNKKILAKLFPNAEIKSRNLSEAENQFWDELESKLAHHTHPVIHLEKAWDSQKLNQFVDQWIGVPYRYGGNSRHGIDCSAFVGRAILSQFPEKKLPRSANGLSKIGKEVSKNDLLPGDLVFFAASSIPGKITHVGIYLGKGVFAHASSSKGVTRSSLDNPYYKKRFVKAIRLTQ
ncbi:MAG: hypothetical protein D6767_02240 [Candidatus Hydrogenedentota bacterium]|nr:MAG: hypothetical protein D6767_02240 [Candidatus Hydrogenedentota bacterium]